MFLENVSRDILDEAYKIYNAVEANGHSGKRTALLTAAFTKPRFPQLTYELCIFPLISRKRPAPVKDTLFTSRGCPLTRASTVFLLASFALLFLLY